jgi:hypothetical protein
VIVNSENSEVSNIKLSYIRQRPSRLPGHRLGRVRRPTEPGGSLALTASKASVVMAMRIIELLLISVTHRPVTKRGSLFMGRKPIGGEDEANLRVELLHVERQEPR